MAVRTVMVVAAVLLGAVPATGAHYLVGTQVNGVRVNVIHSVPPGV
ncbi:MAG: hypothetical protein P8166_16130 [Candidatus Thiodiazotropha sp.]